MKAVFSTALCVLFAATGAASAGEGVLGRLFGSGDRGNEVPKSIWQRDKDASGTHLQTRLRCPASVGAFKLSGLVATDGFGFDVWCQYDTTTRERITAFLTRREGDTLEDHFEIAKEAIGTTTPNATPVATGEETSFTTDPSWLTAVYDAGRLRTGVWVMDFSGWTFKFRATYPPAAQQEALNAMRELAATATGSAGAHLAACAAAPMPAQRNGRVLAGNDPALHGVAVMGIAGHFAKSDRPLPDPVWCVERAYSNLNAPILGWRNIGEHHASVAVQRFTLMTVEQPPTFDVVASKFASEGLNKSRNETNRWLAHILIVMTGYPAAFASFDSEPDPEAVAPIVDGIVGGKEEPVVHVDQKGTFVIHAPKGAAQDAK